MKADLTRREPERLAWWKERDLYRKLRALRSGRPVWLLHDGPPYSNNHLHMGTAANKIWKDAAVRQASLRGFDAPYVPGWDNHGMPIEIQVGREFRERKQQPDRLELRRRCRSYAAEWVGIQREEFERLGGFGEWERPYLTMDPAFEAAIVETFAELAGRGFIQRGLRSIHWCPTDRTALAEAEIEYQDDASPSLYVTFPLRRDPRGAFAAHPGIEAVAWTTTPWTLPANLGLMVDPAAEYVVARAGGRRFLLAAARLEAVAAAAGWPAPAVEARLRGEALLDAVFVAPWDGDSRVVDGSPYVSLEDGTGLVHTAPGHGKEDFAVGQRAGLGVTCPVDEAGRFTAEVEPFVGRSVIGADVRKGGEPSRPVNDEILDWLRARGRLLAAGTITHAYPHCWRCRQPVIFRATQQWFMIIDHDGHRERALEQIESAVRWDPPASQNRIRESVRGRPDWCLSRQRSWGVGIPAIYCESCGEGVLDPAIMKRAAEWTRAESSDAWYERPIADFVPAGYRCPHCDAVGPYRKETDILDVWFDSGSTHRAVRATHPGLDAAWARAEREHAAAPEGEAGTVLYFEGPDQHRGWFNSSLMVGTGVRGRAPFTDVATHGWVLDAQGRAMHKSLGNVISPMDVAAKHGAEIVRWWALATDWRSDVRVGEEILQRVSDAYRKVRNTFRFLLANLDDFDPKAHALPAAKLTAVDRAFLGHLEERLGAMYRAWTKLQFHRALDQLQELCTTDLSAVFLDVSKDRLYTLSPADPARRSAQTVLWRALHDLALAASPALVFTAEEVWQHHPGLLAECESVHLAVWPEPAVTAGGADWAALLELRGAVNAALEPLRASKQLAGTADAEVTIRLAPATLARHEPWRAELAGFLLVADARLEAGGEGQEIAVEARKTAWPRCDRCWTHRADVSAEGPQAGLCGRCLGVLAVVGPGR